MDSQEGCDEIDQLQSTLEKDLLNLYGPLLSSEVLQKVLGYSSRDAFRQAINRQVLDIPLFDIAHRKGKFALAKDVAVFIAKQRYADDISNNE